MPDQIDLDLLRLAAGGDRAAWDSLILRHYERLVRWGRKFVKSEDDARDIAQDQFIGQEILAKSFTRDMFHSISCLLTMLAAQRIATSILLISA